MSIMATTFLVVGSSTVSLSVSSQLSNEGQSFQCRINTVYQGMKLANKKRTNKHTRVKLVTTYFLRAETPIQNWVSRKLRPKTRKTFCLYTISVPLNTATCTKSMYLLPFYLFRGPSIFFSREYDFFVCLSEMLRQKKCVGCIAGVFIEMSARIVNMEKV